MDKSDASDLISEIKNMRELDTDFAISAIGGSEYLYEKLLIKIIRLIPSNIETMDRYLVEEDDLSNFAIKAHGIKGSLRQAGNIRISELAESLERAAKSGNRQYCIENYGFFKESLLQFYKKVNALIQSTGTEPEDMPYHCINNYIDELEQAKAAVSSYDNMLAAKFLTPLLKCRFGEHIDRMLADVMNALEGFHYKQAITHITELLGECRRSHISDEEEIF